VMGLEAIYCKPGASTAQPGHEIYPYLLRNKAITGPDQVWCADPTKQSSLTAAIPAHGLHDRSRWLLRSAPFPAGRKGK